MNPRLASCDAASHLAPVAQLDRASVYGTEGQRFESSRARTGMALQSKDRWPAPGRNWSRGPSGSACRRAKLFAVPEVRVRDAVRGDLDALMGLYEQLTGALT